ncbi:FimD/PapC N-terminal domain-containing protein, partial [Escherichia coli]
MTAFSSAFKAYCMQQILVMPRFARLTLVLGLATVVFPVDAEYYFNPRFLSNDLAESVDLSAFANGREAPPGTYRVDIYLNDEFMTSRDVTFIADSKSAALIPCLSTDLLVTLGIKRAALLDNKEHSAEKHLPDNSACMPLQDRLADASTVFDVGQQHLSLSVPQIYVSRMARGYVSPDLWEEGINAGLLNYSFNGNSINNHSHRNAGKTDYAYLNLQSGINIGSWRLRDNSTWNYNSGSGNSSDSNKWQHINTSAERDIISLRSRLTVGDSYTDGDIFDSVNFRGLKINSTEAMLPDSQHGFAPVIHGIAR